MLNDFDTQCQHLSMSQSISKLRDEGIYEQEYIATLSDIVLGGVKQLVVQVRELREGMVLDEHVLTLSGDILIAKGHELTPSLIQRIRTFESNAAASGNPSKLPVEDEVPLADFLSAKI